VVERYARHRVEFVRTDHSGAVVWRFGPGAKVEREQWRTAHPRYWHNQPGARARPSAFEEPEGEEMLPPAVPDPLPGPTL
jgi:hypothetical protein